MTVRAAPSAPGRRGNPVRHAPVAAARTDARRADAPAGRVIGGRYRVVDRIGVGSLATVYRCDEISTAKRVAVKVFRREFAKDEEFVARLRRQAELAAAFRDTHPGLLSVYDCGQTDDGRAFLVTEYVDGLPLTEIVRRRGPLDLRRALRLACRIAEALDGIHARGFVHADLRAQHVILSKTGQEESVTLKGFEIAGVRETALLGHLVRAGVLSANPEYAAPEQIDGDRVTVRTDIYAFGVILYEMLAGRVPFSASSPDGVLAKHLQEEPIPLSAIRRGIPPVVELRVRQALEKEPERRQRYVGDVANEYLCELAAEEVAAEQARRQGGAIRKIAIAVLSRLPGRWEPSSAREPLGMGWKIAALVALLALLFFPAIWLVSVFRAPEPPGLPQALQWSLDTARPVAIETTVPSAPVAPESLASPGPAVDASGGSSAETGSVEPADQAGTPEASEQARKQAEAEVSPPAPRESSLRPPGAMGGRDARPRPQEPIDAPLGGGRREVPPPEAPAAPPTRRETAPPVRELPDPSAIIDWLLGQPSTRD